MTRDPAALVRRNNAKAGETGKHVSAGLELYPSNYDGIHRAEMRPEPPQLVLSQPDYERFRAFVQSRIGLDVTEDRRFMLGRALAEGMQAGECADLDELYRLLQLSSNTSSVWDRVVSALTVGETYFFRNTGHFDALAKQILPDLLAAREHSSRRLRIWSAGCATGEEPYSIAILLNELIPNLDSWNIFILATDINRDELRRAHEAQYGAWSFRGVDKRVQDTYFQLNYRNLFALSEKIKRMVTFEYLNLVADPYPSLANNTNAMDVILCRNVTIYFEDQVTQKVVSNFYACLTDQGWLIPGAAEPNMVFYNAFEPRNFPGAVIYQKPATPKAKPALAVAFQPTAAASVVPVTPPRPIERPAPIPARPPEVKEPPPRNTYEIAIELLQAGQVDEALAKLYEHLDQDAEFIPTYYTLGKIYANKGNLEEAQTWCERAIKKDKLHPEPYYTLSLVYEQIGLNEMAMDMLKKAIYLDRSFVLAHYNLAQLYQCQGDETAARKSLQNARALLDGKPRDALVPEGDGLVVGRLLELIENGLAQDA